ncbi:hypothetical protein FGG08_005939 [Glutinoglossum americanum]|uniref:C6 finger domain protein n=1 Tax=Glutinoglossum americanum TaxID=1670608 RepID=A0A9P8L2F4_9PEZI|nr:hypothetical protein FGG08_005939 [Glutinoglossum americanum]
MTTLDFPADSLIDVGFVSREERFPSYLTRSSWPLPMEQTMSQSSNVRRATTPLQTGGQGFQATNNSPTLMAEWFSHPATQLQYTHDATSLGSQLTGSFGAPYQASPTEYIPSTQPLDASSLFSQLPESIAWPNWQDYQTESIAFDGLYADMPLPGGLPESSPTDTFLEVRSLNSSNSESGWATVDIPTYGDSFPENHNGAIFNPAQTLHVRTNSSHSDSTTFGSYEEIIYPLTSPDSESHLEFGQEYYRPAQQRHRPSISPIISPSAVVDPVPIKSMSPLIRPSPIRTSPMSQGMRSPPARRQSRKSPTDKATKPLIRRPSAGGKKDTEKRVGRRRGPLLPEQRKQASEIRKLRACLRCKFLKKTDIAYFMKDWKADFERHVSLGFSVGNIKGFASTERRLYITHGYGFVLPIEAREVYVRDDKCFSVDWVEEEHGAPREFCVSTAKLSAGMEGISTGLLAEYLDRHIDGPFEKFVDEYFAGTPFLTEVLKTAHRYYLRERLPVVRKALKLVLAYNLTMHITMVEGLTGEENMAGKIRDENSRFKGKTVAPVMINFQVKCALADMWRELQKDVLEELSQLYHGVYNGDKLKNWPTIFLLAAILLAVWEEMQFDCHYRVPDPVAVQKFCNDMETTPVGVIVGLFSAISQKLPAISEWDTRKHHHLLNSNQAVCDAMSEMQAHVTKYGTDLHKDISLPHYYTEP